MNKSLTRVAAALAIAFTAPVAFAQSAYKADKPMKDIVQVAVEAGSFETLVTAVKAADLVETLKGKGPFTVFAPTDAAFAKLPKGALDGLIADKSALTSVLTYHVVAGKVLAADVITKSAVSTVNGQSIDIKVADGKVYVNGAQVVKTDILASNGVIHVIDGVLMPKAASAPASH